MVMMYVRFSFSLRNVEDLLFERGIDICHEPVRTTRRVKNHAALVLAREEKGAPELAASFDFPGA